MSLTSKTGLFEMEPFETAAPVNTTAGFCGCMCACACAVPDEICDATHCWQPECGACACGCACSLI
jgi:hypothetical protein